jgi:5-methylcytosine-specific restriction protein A
MRPTLTKASVLKALRQFDSALRGTREWAQWEQNKAHKYAIVHRGRRYPVKKIASLARGAPVSEFIGGIDVGHTNRLVDAVGFKVERLRGTNPDWVTDELILALSLYLKHRSNPPGKTSREVVGLSTLLNRLGERLFPPSERSATFRNPDGVYMKLMNFRSLDPQYTRSGKKGLTAGAKADVDVWNEFAGDSERCAKVARAIEASLEESEEGTLTDDSVDYGVDEAPEGRVLTGKHVRRERNRKLVERKKQKALKEVGKLLCEACGFDFGASYGERGIGFIECHHTKPLSTLVEGATTHLKDLALVCANCHRIIHRGKHWLTVQELKAMLAAGGTATPN